MEGQRKRKRKRKLLEPPQPSSPGRKVKELITVVKCLLTKSVTSDPQIRTQFLKKLEDVVVTTNKMRKRVSMLAKELILRKLERDEQLPSMNQSFYSALYTSMHRGVWKHGHDDILKKRKIESPASLTLMSQMMSLATNKMAAEVKTHYQEHYERFYNRWRKMRELGKDEKGNLVHDVSHHLDPEKTSLEVLIRSAWKMLRDFEDGELRLFALLPETKTDVSYVTFDPRSICLIFKSLYPEDPLCSYLKVSGQAETGHSTRNYNVADLTLFSGPQIFERLFNMKYINKLRGKDHHFRFSLTTDGYGVALSFANYHEYDDPKSKAGKVKAARTEAVRRRVIDLQPGFAYGEKNKTLDSLADLKGITVRAADPGINRAYTSVDLLTGDPDVRTSVMALRSASFRARTGANKHGQKQKRWHERALGKVQSEINKVPHRNSSYVERYEKYVDAICKYWDDLWSFYILRKRRKLKFTSKASYQRELDREVNKLCKPREGDEKTLLIYGNAASTNSFGKLKNGVKGPAKKLFDHAVRRKAAVTVWADEFRTSKLDIYGHPVIHPEETRADRLQPKPCKADVHGPEAQGCRCYCSRSGCAELRTKKCWCKAHGRRVLQHDVCYHNHDLHGHRMWNRDVVGALNIGCRFLAGTLGLDLGLWSRKTTDDPKRAAIKGIRLLLNPRSWAEIYGSLDPVFSLPSPSG